MRLIYLMAIALGALLAFGIPKVGAEEQDCVSTDKLLAIAETVQEKNGGVPFWFGATEKDGENSVWVYFAGAPGGFHFYWKEGVCKAQTANVPWLMIRVQMGEDEADALRERYVKWRQGLVAPKGTSA